MGEGDSEEGEGGAAANPAVTISVREFLSNTEAAQWKEAMHTEMDAMKSNHTWELPLARGAKPLRVMWVFTLKGGTEGEGGEKLRFKTNLVDKG